MIPGSKVGSREAEIGEEKPGEGRQSGSYYSRCLWLDSPSISQVPVGKMEPCDIYLPPDSVHWEVAPVYCNCPISPSCAVCWLSCLSQLQRRPWIREVEWHVACWGGKVWAYRNSLLQLWLKSELGQGTRHIVRTKGHTLYYSDLFVLLSSCCHCTFKVVATISRRTLCRREIIGIRSSCLLVPRPWLIFINYHLFWMILILGQH